ncbi:MAG: HAMP domain-containing sensor histidine kinase [Bacillota bacterium]|nr:HAMP domain-containing sensor histidine kinase [Bacillota bacterium]
MKFKYLYQLLLSHLSVLLIAFLLLWLLFSSFVEHFIYQNKVDELNSFGEQILNDISDPAQVSPLFLKHYSNILQARNIRFFLFDANSKVVNYKTPSAPLVRLTNKEWTQIQNGNRIMVKRDLKRFGQEVTLVALPYIPNGIFEGGVLLVSPISGINETINQINHFFFYAVISALGVTILLSWFLSTFHVKRIDRIRHATALISNGNYNIHIPFTNLDEIGDLAKDFNGMVGKLHSAQEEIELLENRRRQFIADVSHELKTPLTTMSGLLVGLKNDMIPQNEKERCMELIDKETKRLIRLVNENLDYEKIRSNQIELNREVIPVIEVFEIIKDQLEIQAAEKENEILLEVEEELTVYADYDRLIQILINITKNSIQFTSNGKIYLRGRKNGSSAILEIEDTGIGLKPEEIESIWLRFYKADLSRSSNPYGEFGLGLSIVKKLVEMHKGKIEVFSKVEVGTKFVITFSQFSGNANLIMYKND